MVENKIRIVSLNCTGLGEVNRRLLHDFLECHSPDILLLQETWLLRRDLCRLNNLHGSYLGRGKSSVPDNQILQGRPYGGLAILWKKKLSSNVSFIDCDKDRILPFILTLDRGKQLLICNVYFPTDNRLATTVSDELSHLIDALEICIKGNSSDFILIGGDFNTDFTRNNAQAKCLQQFLQRNTLSHTWLKSVTTFSGPNNAKSCIDYFMVDNFLSEFIENTEVLDYTVWPKDIGHSPIVIDILCSTINDVVIDQNVNKFKCPAWHKITSYESYQSAMDNILDTFDKNPFLECFKCNNIHCDNQSHFKQIDNLCKSLTDICVVASNKTLPMTRSNKGLPGWKVKVKPLRDDAHFWGTLWKQCGKPGHGVVLDIYRKCRREYHNAVKSIKQQEAQLRREKMAEQIANNSSRDLWKEFNKLKPKSRVRAPNIDGKTNANDICDVFFNKTKTLFNSVPNNLERSRQKIEEDLKNFSENDITVTTEEVKEAISHLKEHKSDGDKGLWSSLVIHSTCMWQELLCQLISAMLGHGHYADELLLSTVVFLPKDLNKSICNSDNYRGISLYSSLNKIIEWIILLKYKKAFVTSELQFAYKRRHSTTMCTIVLKEVVKYYFQRRGDVYCALIDASKAFDRVKLDILFDILIERGLPAPITRLLLDMYMQQRVRTSFNEAHSKCFSVSNGVRQGGVISPILFTLYTDTLLRKLEANGLGCHIGHQYYGALAYADDLTLLAPTGQMLQQMLRVCEEFGNEYYIKFNTQKTVCMLFTKCNDDPPDWINFCGESVNWAHSVKHLGNVIRKDLKETDEIKTKQSDFIGKANSIIANFQSVQRSICSNLFNTQCCSYYGCEAWALTDPSINAFFVTWRKAVRRLWCLPYTARSSLLHGLMGCLPAQQQIYDRSKRMCNALLLNENTKIRFIANVSMKTIGLIGTNLQFLNQLVPNADAQNEERLQMIRELTLCKENRATIHGLNNDDIVNFINFISTF